MPTDHDPTSTLSVLAQRLDAEVAAGVVGRP
jgi:hypothetical protein